MIFGERGIITLSTLHLGILRLPKLILTQAIVSFHRFVKRSPRRRKDMKRTKEESVKKRKIDMAVMIHMKMLEKTLMLYWQLNTSNSKKSSIRQTLKSLEGIWAVVQILMPVTETEQMTWKKKHSLLVEKGKMEILQARTGMTANQSENMVYRYVGQIFHKIDT